MKGSAKGKEIMARSRKKNSNKKTQSGPVIERPAPVARADDDEVDPEVKEIFEEAQQLDYGSNDFVRKLENYTDRSPRLSGGDSDASWDYADVGEETVGGENPTPDQSVVEEEGEALGLVYNDDEPLHTTDKLEKRDRNPWELDPASSPDYGERMNRENLPPPSLPQDEGADMDRDRPSKPVTWDEVS